MKVKQLTDLLRKYVPNNEIEIFGLTLDTSPRIAEIEFTRLGGIRWDVSRFSFQRGLNAESDHIILACEDFLLAKPEDTDEVEAIEEIIADCLKAD